MDTYRFSVVIMRNEKGFHAHCPELDGCSGHGDTYNEALRDVKKRIMDRLEKKLMAGEDIPEPCTPCTMHWSVQYSLN